MVMKSVSSALVAALITLSGFSAVQAIHIQTGFGQVIDTRLDPLRAPGKVASHIHRFAGAAVVAETVNYADLRGATCTTGVVADDKSLYWQPTLYYQGADGSYTRLNPTDGFVVYWFSRKAATEDFVDIPGGLRMITGDPSRNTFDGNNPEHKNNGFACFCNDPPGPSCNDQNVPNKLYNFEDAKQYGCDIVRLETYFPSCWNMKDLDSPDHKSHMMFHPEDQPCPAGWGRIPTLFIEGWYNVAQIPWTTEGKLTLSNGDQTGYSIHGDFINGFSEGTPENPSILRQAMTTCDAMNGDPRKCPLLQVKEVGQCTAPRKVDEDIGLTAPITKIPGNNADWSAPAAKPSEPGYVESAQIINNGGAEAVPVPGVPPAITPAAPLPQPPASSAVVNPPPPAENTVVAPVPTPSEAPVEAVIPPVVVDPPAATSIAPPPVTSVAPPAGPTTRRRPHWRPYGTGRPGGNNFIVATDSDSDSSPATTAEQAPTTSSQGHQCSRKHGAGSRRREARSRL